jgi:hypothetical protein
MGGVTKVAEARRCTYARHVTCDTKFDLTCDTKCDLT